MIAPLDIPRVILSEGVHDLMGAGSSVIDVAEDMQLVDGQTLNHITDGTDEIVSTACGDNRIHDHCHIGGLVDVVSTLVEQLLDDI